MTMSNPAGMRVIFLGINLAGRVMLSRELITNNDDYGVSHPVGVMAINAVDEHEELVNYRTLHVTFTLREERTLIRVISARDMHRKERTVYEQS